MNLDSFFIPVDIESLGFFDVSNEKQLIINTISLNETSQDISLDNIDMVILGVPESRNSYDNHSSSLAPDEIRRQFYRLYCWNKPVRILDLGNLIPGKKIEDTYAILSDILAYLIEKKVFPILLGGSNDLAFACYRAYELLEQVVNIVSVDARFDLGREDQPMTSESYLSKIILQQPNFLLNYANIGYQTYLNSPENIDLMNKLFFEIYRVGVMRKNMEEVEPIVRNAEMLSLDISAIRRTDAPGNPNSSANGFYGEEICQVARFAGLSDKLSCFGIYEYDPTLDYNNQTAQLIGHLIWYFVEGFLNRQNDTSFKDINNYTRHIVTVSVAIDEFVFYCSKKSGRWWMVVPVINIKKEMEHKYFLPCSKNDYDIACNDKIPDRWWRTYNKLNR